MPTPRLSRSLVLLVLVPYGVLVAVKLALSLGLNAPLKVDELGYLGNARYLATGDGLVDATGRTSYKVGYSLALIPAFLAGQDPVAGFKATQVINAFLLSTVLFLAFALAGRLCPALPVADRALLALCVALYPAAQLYATTAMSANAFLPCFLLYALGAQASLGRPTAPGPWLGWGAAAALLYGIHERGIGPLGVAAVTALVAVGVQLRRRRARAWAPLGLLAAVVAIRLALAWLTPPGAAYATGDKGSEVLLRALADPLALGRTFVGQLWYVLMATAGVVAVAVLGFRRRATAAWPAGSAALAWVLAAASASVFAISVLFMAQRPNARFSHWIYGRYNDGILLPLLVFALVALWQAGAGTGHAGQRGRRFAVAATVTVATIAGLSAILDQLWYPGAGGPFSFSGVGTFALGQTPLGWGVLRTGAVAIAVTTMVAAGFAWRWRAGVVMLAAYFVLGTGVTYARSWATRYPAVEQQRTVVDLVRRLDPATRTIFHVPGSLPYHFHYYNLSYFLPDYDFRPLPRPTVPAARGEAPLPSDALVVSGRGLGIGCRGCGARLVGFENLGYPGISYRQGLWLTPGPLQDELATRGWLLPQAFPSRLPRAALASSLSVATLGATDGPVVAQRGASIDAPIDLRHEGTTPWPNTSGLRGRPFSVGVEVRWNQGAVTRHRAWVPLPRTLFPGDEVTLPAQLTVPDQVGRYRLVLTVTQRLSEGQRRGDTMWAHDVEVRP